MHIHLHTMDYSAIKKKPEALIHATTQMNVNSNVIEKSQIQRAIH